MEMSRKGSDVNTTSNSKDGWEVESLHSEDEETVTKSQYLGNITDPGSTRNIPSDGIEKTKKLGKKEDLDQKPSSFLSRKLWSIFHQAGSTPPGGRITPKDDDGNPGPSPVRRAFSKNSEKLATKTITKNKSYDHANISAGETSQNRISHYSNPAYIPSLADEENENESGIGSSKRRSYEAPIYSVNSAGHPVPITIEESENEEDDQPYNGYEKTGREITSSTRESSLPTASRLFGGSERSCCSIFADRLPDGAVGKARTLWRHTYKPDSPGIFYWLCAVTVAFLFNLWTIPLRGTYTSEIQSSWQDIWFACDAICDLINVIDIFIKFRTCYISSGVFVSDLALLNRYHRRKWTFVFDILAIIPTDLFFLQTINPYFRLNRLLKIHRIVDFYQLGELSTWSPNLWRSLNLVHLFAVVIHYNACFYYALSETNGFGQLLTSWPYPDPKYFPEYAALYRRYTYSFYWCLVSLGIVGDRYFPESDWQFLFSIYLHFLGFFFMVIFIAFVTVVMFGKGIPKFEFEKTMQDTKAYMKQRKLPKDLRARVLRFYQYCWTNNQFPHLDENNMLRHLPKSVRQEIELNSNFTALKQIPSLARCDSIILRELVFRLRRCIYLPGQFVYRSGDLGTEMYIVGEGILQVIRDGDPAIYSLHEGDVFGELDLLDSATKRRTADVVSFGYSELYALSGNDITDTLQRYPKFMHMVYQQEKRRQNMQSNLTQKECRAFGGKYHAVSTTSIKSQSDSKASASRVHFRLLNGDVRRVVYRQESRPDESPDSGMPSTPSMGHPSNSDSPANMNLPQDSMKPELFDKISSVHQEHTKSLKTSLDNVLYQEIAYLQQRLEDTERERDMKAREITQLRRQLARRGSGAEKSPEEEVGNPSNGERRRNSDESSPVRTADNEKIEPKSQQKVIRSVRKKENESSIDPFGSILSLGKP